MISIIIPTLNEEKVIKSTLLALRANPTIPYEIIVSDGKSSDNTVEIARKYADKVIVYSGNIRQTIAAGRNAGAAVAKGDFLVFMDADCQMENPGVFLNRAISRFQSDADIVALTTNVRVFPKDENLADALFFGLLNLFYRSTNNYMNLGNSFGEFQMIRKEAFIALGGFRNDLVCAEDCNMFLRLSKIGKTLFEPTLTIYHTGRRAHVIGWPRLLFTWFMNTAYVFILNRSFSKEWKAIR